MALAMDPKEEYAKYSALSPPAGGALGRGASPSTSESSKSKEASRSSSWPSRGPFSLKRVIRPICITILYHNLLLFIDIFHIMDMILMLFPLFCMYDDYEGNNCRSQILMKKHRQDTIFMKIRSFGKAILQSFAPEDGDSQKEKVWWATGGPHLSQARGHFLGAPGEGVATLAHLWPSPFAYFI